MQARSVMTKPSCRGPRADCCTAFLQCPILHPHALSHLPSFSLMTAGKLPARRKLSRLSLPSDQPLSLFLSFFFTFAFPSSPSIPQASHSPFCKSPIPLLLNLSYYFRRMGRWRQVWRHHSYTFQPLGLSALTSPGSRGQHSIFLQSD